MPEKSKLIAGIAASDVIAGIWILCREKVGIGNDPAVHRDPGDPVSWNLVRVLLASAADKGSYPVDKEATLALCVYCGNQLPDAANVCPACGKPAASAAATGPHVTTTAGLADNVAGMLAYVTIIPAIVFLVLEPYNQNRFIRFHSFQCLFLCIAIVVICGGLWFFGVITGMYLIMWLIAVVIAFGVFILWLLLLLKAYQGQMWKLPVVGDLAEKQANA